MKALTVLSRICSMAAPIVGLPLLYVGAVMLIVLFFTHHTTNTLMIIAVLLEIIGATAHYMKIKYK
jgi:hypothetical protein